MQGAGGQYPGFELALAQSHFPGAAVDLSHQLLCPALSFLDAVDPGALTGRLEVSHIKASLIQSLPNT